MKAKRHGIVFCGVLLCMAAAFPASGATAAKWFRLTVMQKYSWSRSNAGSFRLVECALFDAAGVQQGVGLTAIDPATTPSQMPSGTCLVSTPYTVASANVKYLFDGVLTGSNELTVSGLPTADSEPYCRISVGDNTTWTAIIAHLPDSSNPISSYLLYVGHQNWEGSERSIARWMLEASYDGETWFTVHDQSKADATKPTGANKPYNGGEAYALSAPLVLPVLTVDSAGTDRVDGVYTGDVLIDKVGDGTVSTTIGVGAAALKVASGPFTVGPGVEGSPELAGVVTVAEGATLSVNGDAALDKIVNGGNVSVASSASLVASPAAGAIGYFYGGGISGGGGIDMVGQGDLEIDGANTYTGDTVVESGMLRFGRATASPARWFRIIFKKKYAVPGSANILSVNEFALYDAEGNQQNIGLAEVGSSVAARQMGPGTCKVESPYSTSGVESLFDGLCGTANSAPQFSATGLPVSESTGYCSMSEKEPSTWIAVTLRLAENAAPVVGYNLFVGYYNWQGLERSPSGWTVEASCNGEDWFVVDGKTSVASAGDHNRWYNGGVPFPLSVAADASASLPAASILDVASGAVAVSADGTTALSRLRVDCAAGSGTIDGFVFAVGGQLHLSNSGAYRFGTALPLTIRNATGIENLRTWTVFSDGVLTRNVRLMVMDGSAVVTGSGCRFIIR